MTAVPSMNTSPATRAGAPPRAFPGHGVRDQGSVAHRQPMLLAVDRPDHRGLGCVGQFGRHRGQLAVKVTGRVRAIMRAGDDQRHGRPLITGQPGCGVAVIVTADPAMA
jgi:hypothetical protein